MKYTAQSKTGNAERPASSMVTPMKRRASSSYGMKDRKPKSSKPAFNLQTGRYVSQ